MARFIKKLKCHVKANEVSILEKKLNEHGFLLRPNTSYLTGYEYICSIIYNGDQFYGYLSNRNNDSSITECRNIKDWFEQSTGLKWDNEPSKEEKWCIAQPEIINEPDFKEWYVSITKEIYKDKSWKIDLENTNKDNYIVYDTSKDKFCWCCTEASTNKFKKITYQQWEEKYRTSNIKKPEYTEEDLIGLEFRTKHNKNETYKIEKVTTGICYYYNLNSSSKKYACSIKEVLRYLNTGYWIVTNKSNSKSPEPEPKKNSILWWLGRIADKDIREKAIANHKNKPLHTLKNRTYSNAYYALGGAFSWLDSPQGHAFWDSIYYKKKLLLLDKPIFNKEPIFNNKTQLNNGTTTIKVQRPTPTVTGGKRQTGNRISGRRSKATIRVGHLGYKQVSGY